MVGASGVSERTATGGRETEGVRMVEEERCGKSDRDAPEVGTRIKRERGCFSTFSGHPNPANDKEPGLW